MHLQLAGQSI
jgi:hypothetical protein